MNDQLTEQEAEQLGRTTFRIGVGLSVAAILLMVVAAALALSAAGEAAGPTKVGKAVYGYGQISYGGKGPEAWRWDRILVDRERDRLQHRLTARVLEAQALRRQVALLDQLNLDPVLAIRVVFGPRSSEALRVVQCESRFSTGARNGQYRGLFQMGSSERATYGHGDTALEQARAAYRYFVASGRDWSPWECKP